MFRILVILVSNCKFWKCKKEACIIVQNKLSKNSLAIGHTKKPTLAQSIVLVPVSLSMKVTARMLNIHAILLEMLLGHITLNWITVKLTCCNILLVEIVTTGSFIHFSLAVLDLLLKNIVNTSVAFVSN